MTGKVLQMPTKVGPEAAALMDRMQRMQDGARFVTEDEQRARREAWDQAQWGDRLRSSCLEIDDDSTRSVLSDRYELSVGADGKPLPVVRMRSWYASRHPLSPDERPSGPPWLFLCGPKGCGKSTAAGYLLARQWGLATTMTALLADFVAWKRSKPFERHGSMWERCKRAGVLVLDEVGTERDSDAELAREAMFALVNGRQSKRLDTLVLTNLSKQMMVDRIRSGVYDERTHDRLRGIALVVGFEGGSLRRSLPGGGL